LHRRRAKWTDDAGTESRAEKSTAVHSQVRQEIPTDWPMHMRDKT
jgi:hypothetical protein